MRTLTWLAAAALLAAGCEQYRIETVLYPDGRVDRAVYQPLATTPEAARRPELWQQVTYARAPKDEERDGWSGKITDLPIHEANKDRPYFAAWGRFASPQKIPDHFLLTSDDDRPMPPGRLVRSYSRKDYVFVVEHRWTETLTDHVTLKGMQKARDEVSELLLKVAQDVFDEALGKEYDAANLFRWLRGQGKAWLDESTDFAYLHCVRKKGPEARRELRDGLLDIAGRHGLELRAHGMPLEGEERDKALEQFVTRLLCRHILRKKDRQPVEEKTVAGWIKELRQTDAEGQQKPGLFEAAATRVLTAKYGGKEAFERRVGMHLSVMLGRYNALIFTRDRYFECGLKMPGQVVETNGQVLGDNRVRWVFEAADAWPMGYEMSCVSLEAQPQTQKELLRGQPLTTREEMLRFRTLLEENKDLADVLQRCCHEKGLAPLYTHAFKGDNRAQVFKLLRLPPEPPRDGR